MARVPLTDPLSRLLLWWFRVVGSIAYLLGIRRPIVLDGLTRAYPSWSEAQRRALALKHYRHLGQSLGELFLGRLLSPASLDRLVFYEGLDAVREARKAGKGVILASAHFGNLELLIRALAQQPGVSLTVLHRNLKDGFNKWIFSGWKKAGAGEILDKDVTAAALAVLRRGESLGLAIDQNMLVKKGIFVDFFGTQACTTPAPAVLSLRTGAPVFLCLMTRNADGTHTLRFEHVFTPEKRAPGLIEQVTLELNKRLERLILEYPDQWFWVHRRWKTRPPVAVDSGAAGAEPSA